MLEHSKNWRTANEVALYSQEFHHSKGIRHAPRSHRSYNEERELDEISFFVSNARVQERVYGKKSIKIES